MPDPTGVWRLVELTATAPGGGAPSHPLGRDARGLLVYTADGWMSVHVAAADGSSGHFSYCGRWELRGGEVVHRVLLDARPERPGSEQRRGVAWDGGELVLTKRRDDGGVETIRWRRAVCPL